MEIFYVSVTFNVDKRAGQSFTNYYGAPASRYTGKQYTYKSPVWLAEGSLVVVNTPAHGETVAQVVKTYDPDRIFAPGAYKWISGIVDTSLLKAAWEQERIEKEAREREAQARAEARAAVRRLESEIGQRKAAAQRKVEERMLHEVDPTIPELLRQLEAAKALVR